MKVPFSWLKEYVDIDVTAQELEEKLFSCGFEVEELIPLDAGISKVVVGKIVEMEKQEGTHLTKCVVDCGDYGHDIRISTGATNMKLGDCVPAALDGSTLPGGIKIKARKMQGVESNGMLCSGEELGLNDDLFPGSEVYGLLILPEDSVPGTDIAPVVGLDDYIFDISITANRPDCQSVIGIAREVAAILNKPLHMPAMDYKTVCDADEPITVKVEAPDLCPRYMAHYVRNIRMGESPRWMKRHLALCGLRSISNVVDITNHTLLEMGQPMHAFDLNKVAGRTIDVRRAHEGEKIVTLDEKEFTLNPNNLVICDGVKPVALAGVMGGLNSEIRDTTESVIFESAKFARDSVRKTARSLGKSTDASARYEKGVDEYSTVLGMKRALHLIEELQCGKVSSTHVDINTGNSIEPTEMNVSISKVNGVLGITVPEEDIVRIMKNLDFAPTVDGDQLTIHVPAYREDMLPNGENDVERYPDVAEEVIRMYGYDHIVPTFLPTAQVTMGGLNKKQKGELALKRTLCAIGINECMHYSFFSPADLDLMKFPEDAQERNAIRLLNPINQDLSLMRTTLAPSMVNAIARNEKNGILSGRLFEVAKKFLPKSLPLTEYPEEKDTLCIGIFGLQESFYTMKSIANTIAESLDVTFTYTPTEKPFLHPYQAVDVLCEGEVIGYFGKLAYDIQDELNMRTSAFILEMDLEKLSAWYGKKRVFESLNRFSEEKRDLALVMNKDITYGQVEECIRRANKYIKEIRLFDVYEGGQIPEGKKSMAYTITFAPKEEAFDAEAIQKFVDKICRTLKNDLDIDLRA